MSTKLKNVQLLNDSIGSLIDLHKSLQTLTFQDGFTEEERVELDRMIAEVVTMKEHVRTIRNTQVRLSEFD